MCIAIQTKIMQNYCMKAFQTVLSKSMKDKESLQSEVIYNQEQDKSSDIEQQQYKCTNMKQSKSF